MEADTPNNTADAHEIDDARNRLELTLWIVAAVAALLYTYLL